MSLSRNRFRRMLHAGCRSTGRSLTLCKGTILGNGIASHWFTDVTNFGDLLTPAILRHYGVTPILRPLGRARLLAVGSLLTRDAEGFGGHIIGTGLIEDITLRLGDARVWAVRGELTRERLGLPAGTLLGDPGLLAAELLRHRQPKRHALGIIPHYVDRHDPRVAAIARRHPGRVLVIDVMRKPKAVLADIDRCEHVLSSSLHGLIAADSLGVPNAWVSLSGRVVGGGFKFRDYESVFGRSSVPVQLDGDEGLAELISHMRVPPAAVSDVRARLDGVFRAALASLISG